MADSPKTGSLEALLQSGSMVPTHGLTEAMHIGESELPFADIGDAQHLSREKVIVIGEPK